MEKLSEKQTYQELGVSYSSAFRITLCRIEHVDYSIENGR